MGLVSKTLSFFLPTETNERFFSRELREDGLEDAKRSFEENNSWSRQRQWGRFWIEKAKVISIERERD